MSRTGTILETSQSAQPIPAALRAAVARGKGRVVVEDVPVPRIAAGEVLIRVAACGICGTDIKKIEHGFVAAPQIFGHEVSGTVVAVGAGVTQWKLGDRVMSFHHIPCGACFYCDRRLYSQCDVYKMVGLTAGFDPNGGGFAQYVKARPWVAQRGMLAIPNEISFEEATFIEPVNTCLKAVEKARVSAGETVLIMGQGPIGLLLMMLSKLAGAFLVAVPLPAALTDALAIARPGGRILLFAQNDPQMRIEFPAAAVGVAEKEILGSYSAAVDRQAEAARLIFSRQLPVRELVSHRFPLEDMNQALELAAHPISDSLKVVVQP